MVERGEGRQEGRLRGALRRRYNQFLDRLEQNPDLLRHYLVEALAPLPFSQVSRIARGSELEVGRIAHGMTYVYEVAGVIGSLRTMTPEPLLVSHMLVKGVEGASLLLHWYVKRQVERERREREERDW